VNLAAVLGRFVGAVLAECGPVIVEIIANAIKLSTTNTVEDGAIRDGLRERLLSRLHPRPNDPSTVRGTGTPSGDPEKR